MPKGDRHRAVRLVREVLLQQIARSLTVRATKADLVIGIRANPGGGEDQGPRTSSHTTMTTIRCLTQNRPRPYKAGVVASPTVRYSSQDAEEDSADTTFVTSPYRTFRNPDADLMTPERTREASRPPFAVAAPRSFSLSRWSV